MMRSEKTGPKEKGTITEGGKGKGEVTSCKRVGKMGLKKKVN